MYKKKFESLKNIKDLKLTVIGSNQDIFSKLSNTPKANMPISLGKIFFIP